MRLNVQADIRELGVTRSALRFHGTPVASDARLRPDAVIDVTGDQARLRSRTSNREECGGAIRAARTRDDDP